MKRKRAPGGGRKPKAGVSTSSLTFRIPDDLRRQLEAEVTNGGVAKRLVWHLRRSFNRQREEERDPALSNLLFLISQLAEELSGGQLMKSADKDLRLHLQRQWRTDLFNFRAFKLAVRKLLDALEEPADKSADPDLTDEQRKRVTITEEDRERVAREHGGGPEFIKLYLDAYKSPETLADHEFKNLMMRAQRTHPMTDRERELIREDP